MSIAALAMADFVREVRARCDGVIDPAEISRFLAANRIEAASLDDFVRFAPGRYTRHLVHKDRDVEILVLCWARGSTAPIHGHEGEYCWARVERGRLAFASYREASRAPLRLEPLGSAVEAGPGYVDGPADIHAVTNPGALEEDAVSLHVYCRPYDASRGNGERRSPMCSSHKPAWITTWSWSRAIRTSTRWPSWPDCD